MNRHSIRPRLIWFCGITASVFACYARAQTSPAAATSKQNVPLSSYVPQPNIYFYLEFEGLAAHADAWKASAANKILSETKTGAMFEEILTQAFDTMLTAAPNRQLSGADVTLMVKHALDSGFVLAQQGPPTKPITTLVVRNVMSAEMKPLLARFLGTTGLASPTAARTDKPGGRRVVDPKTGQPNWWVEKSSDLVLTDAANVDAVIAAIDGKGGNMTNHARRTKLVATTPGIEPVGWGFFETAGLPPIPNMPANLGLEAIKAVEFRWGLDGTALKTMIDVDAPAPRSGALALVDQPTFELSSIPAMPENCNSYAVLSLDPSTTLMKVATLMDQAGVPDAGKMISDMEAKFQTATKLELRRDVLAHLGPRVVMYTVPEKKGVTAALNTLNPLNFMGQIPRLVVAVEVKDDKALNKALTQLMTFANKQIVALMPAPPPDPNATGAAAGRGSASARAKASKPSALAEFKMMKPKPLTYQLILSPQVALMFNARVTLVLTSRNLIISTEPGLAADAAALDEKAPTPWTPSGDYAAAVAGIPSSLVFFNVDDPRDSLPTAIAGLPGALQSALSAIAAPPSGSMSMAGAVAGGPTAAPGGRGPVGAGVGEGAMPGRGGSRTTRGPQGAAVPGGAEGAPSRGPVGASASGGTPGNADQGFPGQTSTPPGGGPPQTSAASAGNPFAGMKLNIPPDKIPSADSIRPLLFPGAAAISVDATGIHIVSREAFPDLTSLTAGLSSFAATRAMTAGQAPAGIMAGGQPSQPGQPGAAPGQPPAAGAGGGGARTLRAD